MSRRMLLITHLDVWMLTPKTKRAGVGNQSLYNTLLGYARAGYEVHMLTTSTALAGMAPIHNKSPIDERDGAIGCSCLLPCRSM